MKGIGYRKTRISCLDVLQVSYGAPVLADNPAKTPGSIDIAMLEHDMGMVPITINRE